MRTVSAGGSLLRKTSQYGTTSVHVTHELSLRHFADGVVCISLSWMKQLCTAIATPHQVRSLFCSMTGTSMLLTEGKVSLPHVCNCGTKRTPLRTSMFSSSTAQKRAVRCDQLVQAHFD